MTRPRAGKYSCSAQRRLASRGGQTRRLHCSGRPRRPPACATTVPRCWRCAGLSNQTDSSRRCASSGWLGEHKLRASRSATSRTSLNRQIRPLQRNSAGRQLRRQTDRDGPDRSGWRITPSDRHHDRRPTAVGPPIALHPPGAQRDLHGGTTGAAPARQARNKHATRPGSSANIPRQRKPLMPGTSATSACRQGSTKTTRRPNARNARAPAEPGLDNGTSKPPGVRCFLPGPRQSALERNAADLRVTLAPSRFEQGHATASAVLFTTSARAKRRPP